MGIDAEMFVRTRHPVTEAEAQQWAYELGATFGHDKFWICDADSYSGPRRALSKVAKYEQDGDDIDPEPGETFLLLAPKTRFYGEGYERGDLPFLIMLAEWCEARIPGASVWYGGDSSGVCAEPFTKERRQELFQHFVKVGHAPYVGMFSRIDPNPKGRFCTFCEAAMTQYGVGPGYASLHCDGCGFTEQTRDNGETWQVVKKVGGQVVDGMEKELAAL